MSSNTPRKKAEPKPDTNEDGAAIQSAQDAEANDTPRTVEFDGHTYNVRDNQPSPKAITYIARWEVDDENLAMVLAIVEMVGQGEWARWCDNHASERINDFWLALNRAVTGTAGN